MAIFVWPRVLSPSRALVDSYMDWSGMPLHDAVRVNCKKGATTENQGRGA